MSKPFEFFRRDGDFRLAFREVNEVTEEVRVVISWGASSMSADIDVDSMDQLCREWLTHRCVGLASVGPDELRAQIDELAPVLADLPMTEAQFEANADALADMLLTHNLCDGTSACTSDRTFTIDLYGHELTSLLVWLRAAARI